MLTPEINCKLRNANQRSDWCLANHTQAKAVYLQVFPVARIAEHPDESRTT